jgi:hypothetical protein
VTTKETAIMSKSGTAVRTCGKIIIIGMTTLLLKGNAALADDSKICDYEHKCYNGTTRPPPPPQIYHMDPAHPDKETPPPAPQYPGVVSKPYVPKPQADVAPPVMAEVPEPTYNPNADCDELRRGLYPTPEAAWNARAHCEGGAQWYPQ